jgi:hypothetical protein
MKKILLATTLIALLPTLASAEMKMQNNNPSPEAVVEPTLGHHMQNSDPSPEQKAEATPEHVMHNSNPSSDPVPEHMMKNSNPKKWVSTNAASLEEKHTAK